MDQNQLPLHQFSLSEITSQPLNSVATATRVCNQPLEISAFSDDCELCEKKSFEMHKNMLRWVVDVWHTPIANNMHSAELTTIKFNCWNSWASHMLHIPWEQSKVDLFIPTQESTLTQWYKLYFFTSQKLASIQMDLITEHHQES